MRQIDIDTDVFSKIWAHRLKGEECENAILRRLLVGTEMSGGSPQKPATTASKSIVVTGEQETDVPTQVVGKHKWRDDVRRALEEFGNEAHLSDIYVAVRAIRRQAGRSLPRSTEAVIRRELENNSSDSDSWTRDRDWFSMPHGKGAGVWALKKK